MGKNRVKLMVFAVVLLLAAAFMYYDTWLLDNMAQTARESQSPGFPDNAAGNVRYGANSTDAGAKGYDKAPDAGSEADMLVNTEIVPVEGNTAEYDLVLKLCENSSGKTFVQMEYFHNGVSVLKELDESQLPELSGMFRNRRWEQKSPQSYTIGRALLNPVYEQLYMLINGAQLNGFLQASFYLVNLNDMSVKKLFSYPGLYGKMSFNRDFSLLAYSLEDPPNMGVYREDYLLEVFDCKNAEYVIRGNRLSGCEMMGSNSSSDCLYDYEFISWRSDDEMLLKQGVRPLKEPDSEAIYRDVLYNIQENLLLNIDGSRIKIEDAIVKGGAVGSAPEPDGLAPGNGQDGGNAEGTGNNAGSAVLYGDKPSEINSDSGPANTLKKFYAYLASENDYVKAMQLLDENFRLRLNILKQFGVEEISRNDIEAEYEADNAALYGGFLKAARLGEITGGKISEDGTAVVAYYQLLDLSSDSSLSQLLSAKMRKVENEWKILLIEDGIQ